MAALTVETCSSQPDQLALLRTGHFSHRTRCATPPARAAFVTDTTANDRAALLLHGQPAVAASVSSASSPGRVPLRHRC